MKTTWQDYEQDRAKVARSLAQQVAWCIIGGCIMATVVYCALVLAAAARGW